MTTAHPPGTRVIYALIDPRDNLPRYLGQLPAPRRTSLARAALRKQPTARAVSAWLRELTESGHTPTVELVRDAVPAAQVQRILKAELTERLAAGAPLLNEQGAAEGRKKRLEWQQRQRAEEETAAWAEMAEALRTRLGGPLPPAPCSLHLPEGLRAEIARMPDRGGEEQSYAERRAADRLRERLEDELMDTVAPLFRDLHALNSYGDKAPYRQFTLNVCSLARHRRRAAAGLEEAIGLVAWCMYAAAPWYRLARAGKLAENPAQFTRWLGDTPAAHALRLLENDAEHLERMLAYPHAYVRSTAETCLVATAAAHCGIDVPAPLHMCVRSMLADMLLDPMLTQPMAALLLRLDPHALNSLGPDVAPSTDEHLALPAGTTARVLAHLTAQAPFLRDRNLRHAAWRSRGTAPTVAVPDYAHWSGPTVPTMRVVSATLIHAGVMAPPAGTTPAAYVAKVQRLLAGTDDPDAAFPCTGGTTEPE